jgi:hypothetical protein
MLDCPRPDLTDRETCLEGIRWVAELFTQADAAPAAEQGCGLVTGVYDPALDPEGWGYDPGRMGPIGEAGMYDPAIDPDGWGYDPGRMGPIGEAGMYDPALDPDGWGYDPGRMGPIGVAGMCGPSPNLDERGCDPRQPEDRARVSLGVETTAGQPEDRARVSLDVETTAGQPEDRARVSLGVETTAGQPEDRARKGDCPRTGYRGWEPAQCVTHRGDRDSRAARVDTLPVHICPSFRMVNHSDGGLRVAGRRARHTSHRHGRHHHNQGWPYMLGEFHPVGPEPATVGRRQPVP